MYNIGVDIGGTNLAIGLVNESLEIVQRTSVPFPKAGGGPETARQIWEKTNELLDKAGGTLTDLESVGVVVPGSIDATGSIVINAYNLGFHDEPLKERIVAYFRDIPVFLANDANGAALAELYRGAFVGCNTAALLTLGTGVGGGLIIGGRMFNGGMNNGVEIGHALLASGGKHCTCGNNGCIEAYCSATALKQEGIKAMQDNPDSMLYKRTGGKAERMNAKVVIDCAKEGDESAVKVFDEYVDYLGSAVASLINILDCECVAIGGGVSAAGEFLFASLRQNVHKKSFFENHGRVVPAVMGNDAGIIGAAMLKRNRE
ncbi:MAG: ROK family protein [Christensenellales bacterium]